MKKVMIGLLLASAAVATPAQARDGSWYAGIEAGALWAKDQSFDYSFPFFDGTASFDSEIDYSTGTDVDLIGGYDFGMFRAELELGYKHATHERYRTEVDYFYYDDTVSEGYGKTDVYSAMVNLLFDGGNQDGFSFYAGPGVGLASTKITLQDRAYDTNNFTLKDSGLALQGIAGVRYALSTNLDVGLKYRYFYGNKINDDIDGFFDDESFDVDGGRFKSHSLMASLIYNFAPPPPPPVVVVEPAPVPVEPAPQMQTCWDGSMIPVTSTCPAQPAPVTPAPTPGERG